MDYNTIDIVVTITVIMTARSA